MHIIIIGSGIAGITFAEKIRQLNADVQLTILTQENFGYYSRPILSHGFSKQNVEQNIVLKSFAQIEQNNIRIISDVEVTTIDRRNHCVSIKGSADFTNLTFDNLILAPGSEAFIPPPFRPYREHFFLLNNLADLKLLRKFRHSILENNATPDWAIIGGGLIGCEMASDLAVAGDKVTIFHAMDRLMERQLVAEDSQTLLQVLQSAGLNILLEQAVSGFQEQDHKVTVDVDGHTENNDFDAIIVSCGFKPRTELAVNAGLDVGRGIKVNQFLQSTDDTIYALGDVAELPNQKLYAFIMPIRSQALWLAAYLSGNETEPWSPPVFNAKAKVHGFVAANPYIF